MIGVRAISKRFGRLQALDGLSLDITRTRITAIVGPNGAGKTTLVKTILGLTRPDTGSIEFDGVAIGDDGRYRARIGYMQQIARFPGNLTPESVRRGLSSSVDNRSSDTSSSSVCASA